MPTFAEKLRERRSEQGQSLTVIEGGAGASFAERLRERQKLREQGVSTPSPTETDISQRSQALAEKVGQTSLGEPGFPDIGARFDIGLSDTFAEKKDKFLSKFPDGDFVLVEEPRASGQKTVLFRKNAEEPFAEFDAPALEKLELLGDIADISGDLPAIAVEALVTRGAGIVNQLLRIAAGNVTGDVAKEVLEAARGFQKETIGEQAKRIGGRALISAGGGAATVGITGPLNAVRGAGSIKIKPGAREAQRAASELGMPPLLPTQVASSPMIQQIGRQAQATVSTIADYVRDQQKAVVQSLSRLRDKDALRFIAGNFRELHNEAIKQITDFAKVSKTSLTEGGTAIQQGIAEYDNLSRGIVDTAYKRAREIAEPDFDIAPAAAVAKTLKAGRPGAAREGGTIELQAPTDAISKEIDKLEALDPSLPTVTVDGVTMTGTDQLRAIRSNLNSLKIKGPVGLATPEERATSAQANKLFAAIDRVLKNPTNADPKFRAAWGRANTEASKRFSTLEKLIVIEATRNETPAQIASRLAKPLQVDNLRTLKETIPNEQFMAFQEAVKADFIAPQNLNNLTTRLQGFDKETLDTLLSKEAQAELRQVGRDVDILNQANIQGVLQRQASVQATVRELTERSDTLGLSRFIAAAQRFPADSPQRRMIRAGIVEDVFERSVQRVENDIIIDNKALAKELARVRRSGIDELLTADDKRVLGNLDSIADFLKGFEDTGTSLQRASTAAGLRSFSAAAIVTFLENVGTGRLFTNPVFQKAVLGTGKKARRPFSGIRVLGAALALEASEVQRLNREDTSTPRR